MEPQLVTRSHESPIDVEAADWIAKGDRGLSPTEAGALEAWLSADDRHRGAFIRAQAGWLLLDRGRALAETTRAARHGPQRLISRRALALGGSGAIAAGIAGLLIAPRLAVGRRFATRIGEARSVPLADGSSVDLNTASQIAVHYDPGQRAIALDRGEAWFDVAKDKTRPFVVAAGPVRVRAVGTAFSVRRLDEAVQVVVTEGVVEVWREGQADRRPVRLAAGQQALLTPTKAVLDDLPPEALDGGLAWRTGRVVLRDTAVEDAIVEINRYNERLIEITPDARGGHIVGVFRARDPEGFARAAAAALDLRISADDKRILLHR